MHFLQSQHFLKILCKLIDHYLIFNKIEQYLVEFHKIEHGKKLILISNKKLLEKLHRLNIKILLLEK